MVISVDRHTTGNEEVPGLAPNSGAQKRKSLMGSADAISRMTTSLATRRQDRRHIHTHICSRLGVLYAKTKTQRDRAMRSAMHGI